MAQHSTLSPADGIHKPYSFEFADASARASATNPVTSSAYTSADVGKIALQTDDGSIWRLTATTPTWAKIAQQTDVDTVNTALTTHTSNTSNPHSVTASQVGPLNAGEVTSISPSNYTPSAATLAGNLAGIDTALAGAGLTPGGDDKDIQFKNGTNLGGSQDFQIDTQTGKLSAPITESDHVSLIEQESAPPQPSSGFGALYAKNDSKLYYQDDSGTETELTAGASAAGSANQIQYNDGNNAFAASAAQVTSAGSFTLPEISAPSTPSSGFASIYISDDPNSAAAAPPRIHTKDSAGLERTIYPAIERLGVGNAQSNNNLGSFRLGPKGSETTASFTDSTTDFLVMALVRFGPTVIPQTYTDSNREPLFFLVYRGGYASGMDAAYLFDDKGTAYIRNASNSKTTKNRNTVGESIGMFVFHQTQWPNNNVYKGIGIGHVGMSLNIGASTFVDYSSPGSEHEGGSIEFQTTAGSSLLALGVCDNRAGSAGAGWHPFSANAPSAFSTVQEANIAYMKAHDIFMREGTIRNLTSAEIGGSNPLEWDKLYLPSDATVDSDNAITAWPANSASADTSAPNITLLGSALSPTFRYPVTWYPNS